MLVRMKKNVAFGVIALAAAVISPPVASFAATSPTVSVLNPIVQGLRAPVKMVFDAEGNVFVADQRVGGIVKYNQYGVQQQIIRTAASPAGLAFALDGTLLVSQSSFVARYDLTSGKEIGRFADVSVQSITGIAVDDVTGYVYVTDNRANQVAVFTATGLYVKSFAAGLLSSPAGIAFEKISRNIVVANTYGNTILYFDVDGNLVKSVGSLLPSGATANLGAAIGPMQFSAPVAVAFEYSKGPAPELSRTYVVDAFQGNVQVIDSATNTALTVVGTAKNYIGSVGVAQGQLMVPSDAVFDSINSRLLVVNGFGNITIYGIDGGKSPVYIDTLPPVDPTPVVVIPVAPALTVATSATVTNASVLAMTGTVDAGSAVLVTNITTSKSAVATVTGGAWSSDVALVEGVNRISVSAQKGNSEKAVVPTEVRLDTTPPTLLVSALADGSNSSVPVQNVSGTVADLSSYSITVNGVAAAVVANYFSVPVTLLNGANQISVAVVDAVGNSTVNNRTINYSTGSVITVVEPADNLNTSVAALKMSGTVDRTSTVTIAGIPATMQDNNWSVALNLVSGVNTLEITAVDVAGVSTSVKRSIVLDTIKPTLAITAPAQDVAVNVPNMLISGAVTDSSTLDVQYTLNGVTKPVSVTDGTYAFNVDFAAEGIYSVNLTAKDLAGNTSTVVRNVIYDTTPPNFSLNQVAGVMPEKLTGTVESGSTVVVTDGSAPIGVVSIANGSWTADLTGVTYSPESLLAVATDAAGNSTSKTLSYNFPDGTLSGNGKPTVQDALRAIRLVVSQAKPSAQELAHYDIAPLVGGKPNPNGKIEIIDAILILRKALGLKSW